MATLQDVAGEAWRVKLVKDDEDWQWSGGQGRGTKDEGLGLETNSPSRGRLHGSLSPRREHSVF